MPRLSKLEKEMVRRCMEFVEAGEWPWLSDMDGTSERTEEKERRAFESARAKLEG